MTSPADSGADASSDASASIGFCGDGRTDPGEACDDGDSNSDVVPGACRTKCQSPACDDGVVDPDEICLGRTVLVHRGEVRTTGDWNDDGTPDFVTRSDGRFELLISDGDDWTVVWSETMENDPLSWGTTLIDDDDRVDLYAVEQTGVRTWLGTDDGFTSVRVDPIPIAAAYRHFRFTADDRYDLLVGTSAGIALLSSDTTGRFSVAGSVALGELTYYRTSADVDGDGIVDLLLDDYHTTYWIRVSAEGELAPLQPLMLTAEVLPLELDGTEGTEFFTVAPPGFTATFLEYDGTALEPIAGPTRYPGFAGNWFDADGDGKDEFLSVEDGQLSVFDIPSGRLLDSRPGDGFTWSSDLDLDGVTEVTLYRGVEYQTFEKSDERLLGEPQRYSLDVPGVRIRQEGRFFSFAGGLGLLEDLQLDTAVVDRTVDAEQLELLDLNADGILDLLMATAAGELVVGRGDGLGGFDLDVPQLSGMVDRFATTDLDKDGRTDLVIGGGNTVRLARQTGDGLFEVQAETAAGTTVRNLAAGDFDGDGLIDVAVAPVLGAVRILHGQPGPALSAAVTASISTSFLYSAHLDDAPGDELLVIHRPNATLTVLHTDGRTTQVATAPDPRTVTTADLDGDGRPEVIVAARASVQIFDRDLALVTGLEVPGAYYIAAGDLDGDGDTDLLTAAPLGEPTMLTGPSDYGVATPLLAGGGRFTTGQPFYTRGPPRMIALGDTNRDGALDLVALTDGRPIRTAYTPWEPALVTYLAHP